METQAWKELLAPLNPNNTTARPLLTPGTQGPSTAASFTSMDSAPSLFPHTTGFDLRFAMGACDRWSPGNRRILNCAGSWESEKLA